MYDPRITMVHRRWWLALAVVSIYWHPVFHGFATYREFFDDVMSALRDALPATIYATLNMDGLHRLFGYFGKWAETARGAASGFPFAAAARWLGTLRARNGFLGNQAAEAVALHLADAHEEKAHIAVYTALGANTSAETLVRETNLGILPPTD